MGDVASYDYSQETSGEGGYLLVTSSTNPLLPIVDVTNKNSNKSS